MQPKVSQPLIVIATLGRRDLQALIVRDGHLYRISPLERDTGELHRALLQHKDQFRFWMPRDRDHPIKDREERSIAWFWRNGNFGLQTGRDEDPASVLFATAADLDDNAPVIDDTLYLLPGLLWQGLLELREQLQAKQFTLQRFLLMHTDRGPGDKDWGPREPVAAAPLLKEWLPGWLGVFPELIEIVTFLGPSEQMNARDDDWNRFLLPAAAEKIDAAIRRAVETTPGATIRLHDSGGLPAPVEVIRAAARFRGYGKPDYRQADEGRRELLHIPGIVRPAAEILEARRRATEMVRGGEFQAAAVLASSFEDKGMAGSWVRCLQAVARYFQGYMTDAREQGEGLGDNLVTRSLFLELVSGSWPQALHVALRAEAALCAEDFLTAASLSATFFDVALFDGVDTALRKVSTQSCVDWVGRKILADKFRPTESDLLSAAAEMRSAVPWVKSIPEERGVSKWLKDGTKEGAMEMRVFWQKPLLCRLIKNTEGHDALGDALDALNEALNKETKEWKSPAFFRHQIIHSLPSQKELEDMVHLFGKHQLWAEKPYSFLHATTLPAVVLKELSCPDMKSRYEQLVDAVVTDIQQCPLYTNC